MRARTTTAPMAGGALKNRMKRVKQPPSQRLSEKVSGSGWGGLPQRAQRAQRIIGWGECSYIGAVWCNCCGLKKGDFSIILPQNAWIKVLTLPTPMAKSKTPPRPLREDLRIRMGRSGREGGKLFGRPLPRGPESPALRP